ncbi:hypothetical protein B4168_3357 [Anoxybacillus flavithermus]|nr:hypothetical protein B4168_3357 [Anoxybacillus flavithermus]OAO85071.1 hypothetical protein GT23_3125 [Parageobacillus thermoglucosidasius]
MDIQSTGYILTTEKIKEYRECFISRQTEVDLLFSLEMKQKRREAE